MTPIAHIAMFPNGQLSIKPPPGKDMMWMLAWIEIAKDTIKQQLQQPQGAIEVPDAGLRNHLLNGAG